MANFNATVKAATVGAASSKLASSASQGKLRVFTSSYTSVASSEPQVADVIVWGSIPKGARILGYLSTLNRSIGNAGMTFTIGSSSDDNFILAATDIGTAAGVTTLPLVDVGGAVYVTSTELELISVIAVDEMLAGQVVTLTIVYVQD